MSEEYSNGYARGYEAGQQSVLKLAEQPAPVQQPLSRIESAAAKAVNYRTDYQKPLTDRLEQLAEWYDFLKEEVQRLEVALVRQQEQPAPDRDGPDCEDGPDEEGFSGPRPWNNYTTEPTTEERRHVGDSRFESWYDDELDPIGKEFKQLLCEAYEAGMNDPSVDN